MKFVILDEVDYMTKNAQQALRYLLQMYSKTVRFCLICNYISKIDEGLQTEFVQIRFNQLPQDEIVIFLKKIETHEQLSIDENALKNIQQIYKSDIRSMVNYMQTNQNMLDVQSKNKIMNDTVWCDFFDMLLQEEILIPKLENYIHMINTEYNMDNKYIMIEFCNFIIRNKSEYMSPELLSAMEDYFHHQNTKLNIKFLLLQFHSFLSKK
jgi:DNA polymerase III delta prime subunit